MKIREICKYFWIDDDGFFCVAPASFFSPFLDFAFVPLVVEAQWNDDKNEVKEAHYNAHGFGHFPIKGQNGKEDKEKHEKQ